MAGSQHVRARLKPVVAGALAAGAVVLLPGIAHAAPAQPGQTGQTGQSGQSGAKPTVAQVQQQIATLGRQLEQVTEKYNGATIALTKAKQTLATAQANERKIVGTLQVDQANARTVAAQTYREGPLSARPFSEFAAMMASGSPQDFLDRLSTLDVVSQRRSKTIAALQTTRTKAARITAAATRARTQAQTVATELATDKAWIEKRLPQQKTLLASLTAEQRAKALAASQAKAKATTAPPATSAPPAPTTSAPAASPPATASSKAQIAIDAARSKLGAPYVWAAAGPDSFDCSGLTMWAWAQAGVTLPHFTGSQIQVGTPVSRDQLQPGDLVFFYPDTSHVGLYIGNGQMIHAPTTGDVVKIADIDVFPWAGATRVA